MSDEHSAPAGFSGCVRLFPLPNVVLFPHVVQPLHIFEPRYRQMTADALAGDRLIGMVLLQTGWETDYAGHPAVCPVGCLGKIFTEQRLGDGRYNILLRGLSRFRITEEACTDRLYRLARADLLEDLSAPPPEIARKLRRRLLKVAPVWFPAEGNVLKQVRKLIKSEVPVGALCDIIAFALPLETSFKQELLQELHVEARIRSLLGRLEKQQAERKFPPEFSLN
jgi:uncharacterized protein